MSRNYRICHFVMAMVSISYLAVPVLAFPFSVFFGRSLSDATWNVLVEVLLLASGILNLTLFAIRYRQKRDCLLAFLLAVLVVLCIISLPVFPHIFYPGQETHPPMLSEFIAGLHGLPFLFINIHYWHSTRFI